jgi:Xaa-Pro aminopeptidase
MRWLLLSLIGLTFAVGAVAAPEPDAAAEQARAIRKRRLDVLLPQALEQHGFDAWLVFTRENARDPIAEDVAGGRVVARSAFLFARTPKGFRKTAIVASYDVTPVKDSGIYDEIIVYRGEGIKPHLKKVMTELNPRRVAVDTSRDIPLADGLTVGMRDYLLETLGADWASRFASGQPVVVSFRGRRLPEEVALLREAANYTDKIIREALSAKVICPARARRTTSPTTCAVARKSLVPRCRSSA